MEWLERKNSIIVGVKKDIQKSKGRFLATYPEMLFTQESVKWLSTNHMNNKYDQLPKRIQDAFIQKEYITCVNIAHKSLEQWNKEENELLFTKKKKVHILALGDVGSTVLIGLKLLGKDCISKIGICEMNETVCKRWEYEMNQTAFPWEYNVLPEIEIIEQEHLFDCDVFVFCASKGIPPVGSDIKDVRMAQFEANKIIISNFAKKAREKQFSGLFAVISDPVDPLCKAAFLYSNQNEQGEFDGKGLLPEQIQGYGLGVMNARAAYFAKKDKRFQSFLKEGRAFGPHGQYLVIANSIENYDNALSTELTTLAIEANIRTRELGFKPYIAPAFSSAAISLILTMQGKWHYSSNFLGGVYMGCKNRTTKLGLEIESLPLPEQLYCRIKKAFQNLENII